MKKLIKILVVGALLTTSIVVVANADTLEFTDRVVKEFPLDLGGAFAIENRLGRVEVIGVDGTVLSVSAVRHVSAQDEGALGEGRDQTQIVFRGDNHGRLVQTVYPPNATRSGRWTSYVDYLIRIPRTAHVTVDVNTADRIRVANIAGNVIVKNVNAALFLEQISGPLTVSTINGNIVVVAFAKPQSNAQLSTINGNIELRMPSDTSLEWIADTLKGDVYVGGILVRGRFIANVFRGTVNTAGGPTFATSTFMGRISLVRNGVAVTEARSINALLAQASDRPRPVVIAEAKEIRTSLWTGDFVFSTPLGDVAVGEIRGSARIETNAGHVDLGAVFGKCDVTSQGGPLTFGDIFGPLNARTEAGDVFVRAAREGGVVATGGGIVRVLYSAGPISLRSGGGDIILRQASGPVVAETRSGDINITVDPAAKTQKVEAHTVGGNIAVIFNPRFGADVDATILTSPEVAHEFHSDVAGVTIRREQVGNKIRIRATGKINGGGEKLELSAEDGDIRLVTQSVAPVRVMSPQGQP